MTDIRPDLKLIASLIDHDAKILDIGCGEGQLLEHLVSTKNVDGSGMEISQSGVNACVSKGLFVVQGDADLDLADYPTGSFDFVILSRTLQAVRQPREVLLELLRIGKQAIVTIPNFAHWRMRKSLLLRGRMPVTKSLSATWYDTLNIHFCTILDLFDLAKQEGIKVNSFLPHTAAGKSLSMGPARANIFAEHALFLLEKE